MNRNYDYHWGELEPVGSTNVSCSPTYHGQEAFSETELQAVRDHVLGLGGDVVYSLSLHSYGQLIMYPYGYTADLPEDAEDLQRLGDLVRSQVGT